MSQKLKTKIKQPRYYRFTLLKSNESFVIDMSTFYRF